MSDETYILDASALLCIIHGEIGFDIVEVVLPRSKISAVNLAEVVTKLQERGLPDTYIDNNIADLKIAVVPFDASQAMQTGKLRAATKRHGLSLGDRACLALAMSEGAVALTADRAWQQVDVGVKIKLLR